MIQYRETLINQIIQSVDRKLIEPLIKNSLHNLTEKGTHPFILIRFIDKLKTSLGEINREELSEPERNNILHALNVLDNYDIKKEDSKSRNK